MELASLASISGFIKEALTIGLLALGVIVLLNLAILFFRLRTGAFFKIRRACGLRPYHDTTFFERKPAWGKRLGTDSPECKETASAVVSSQSEPAPIGVVELFDATVGSANEATARTSAGQATMPAALIAGDSPAQTAPDGDATGQEESAPPTVVEHKDEQPCCVEPTGESPAAVVAAGQEAFAPATVAQHKDEQACCVEPTGERTLALAAGCVVRRPRVLPTVPRNKLHLPAAVLTFDGDMLASGMDRFARYVDEVVVNKNRLSEVDIVIQSPGGGVSQYGFMHSQIERLRHTGLLVTGHVDLVAASGGMLMILPCHVINAAPMSIVGSVGVISMIPQIHGLLSKLGIEMKTYTAGPEKRTVTPFEAPTAEQEEAHRQQLKEIHEIFLGAVERYRPWANLTKIKTARAWTAEQSVKEGLGLVDRISTSPEYLLEVNRERDLVFVGELPAGLAGMLGQFTGRFTASLAGQWLTALQRLS